MYVRMHVCTCTVTHRDAAVVRHYLSDFWERSKPWTGVAEDQEFHRHTLRFVRSAVTKENVRLYIFRQK